MLKLSIIGNGTLAAATRQCCARHFEVTSIPSNDSDILWFCEDTPIAINDRPDWGWILNRIIETTSTVSEQTLILISSQLPVGCTARLESVFPNRRFAYSPENIRVATAVADFENQARVIVGYRQGRKECALDLKNLEELFSPFTDSVIFTTPESAECTKHFLNCWLGLSVAFINEAARFCASVGADPKLISQALLTDHRVSPKAPLRPGAPFGGGHLARDIFVVNEIAEERGLKLPLISHIMESNRIVD